MPSVAVRNVDGAAITTVGSGLLRRDMLLAHINIVEVQIPTAMSRRFRELGIERRAFFPHSDHDHRELARCRDPSLPPSPPKLDGARPRMKPGFRIATFHEAQAALDKKGSHRRISHPGDPS